METRQIEIFLDLVKTMSIHKTAENCLLSRPTVSTAIKRLEDELNMTLFYRHSGGMTLTRDGQEALYWIEKLHNDYLNLKMISERKLSGTAHIEFPDLFSLCHQNQSQKYAIYDLYPNLKLIASSKITEKIIQDAADPNDLQLHIFYTTPLIEFSCPPAPGIICNKFYDDEMCAIVNKQHILANRNKVSISHLKNELLILQTNFLETTEAKWFFREHGLKNKQVFCTPPSFNGMCQAVRRRNGLAIMSKYVIETSFSPNDYEDFAILSFRESFPIKWYYSYSQKESRNTISCYKTYLENNVFIRQDN